MESAYWPEISRFLDKTGRIVVWPAKKHTARRAIMLEYLLEPFEWDRDYTEKEVNALLATRHAFDDPAYIRRSLIDTGRMVRQLDGTAYRRVR